MGNCIQLSSSAYLPLILWNYVSDGQNLLFLEPEPSFLALIIIFWSQSRAFWLWLFFFWSQSRAFGSEFLFWSLSWSLKFWEPTRALIGSLKFLLVSQDPFMDLVIPDFSPLVPQETILISRQEKAGGGGQECLHPHW